MQIKTLSRKEEGCGVMREMKGGVVNDAKKKKKKDMM